MPKVVLGKTPEQLREEEAKKQRELEAQIQQSQLERQAKLEALHKKQKTTKIAIIATTSFVAASLFIFGTYNTFFKHDLTVDDVVPTINASIDSFRFPSEGLDNYIHDNCEALFAKYVSTDSKNSNISSIKVDTDSCYISRVKKISSTLAQVYFSVDVSVTEKDVEVTDPNIIRQLKRTGFVSDTNENEESTVSSVNEDDSNDEESDKNESSIETEESTESTTSEIVESSTSSASENADKLSQIIVEASPSGLANATDTTNNNSTFNSNVSGENRTYYVTDNGKIMQTGTVSTVRYNFYVPIEFYFVYSSEPDEDGNPTGEIVGGGFRPAGDMTLYSLEQADLIVSELTDEEKKNPYYHSAFTCNEETLLDEETTRQIQVKVNNVLNDLYEGRDTSQEFYNFKKFNTFNSRYDGISTIYCYSEDNSIGYNTKVTYSITTSQGFSYQLETWMKVIQDGNSWVVIDIL